MPQKPLDQLSPSYRKRIENAMAKGKTRQQARGHKTGESKIRREKEMSRYGITSSEKGQITKFFNVVNSRLKPEDKIEYEKFLGRWRGSYDEFKRYKAKINEMHKQWLAMPSNLKYDARGDLTLDIAAQPFYREIIGGDFYFVDNRWFFYH